jgi:V-type H+-transporting ATPase subunit d
MEMNTYNIDDGYAEAIVRALSKSFITKDKYDELTNASDLNEFKVLLEDTDYASYIQSMDDQSIEPVELKRRMYEKLRDEMEYLMAQASEPLATFLQMMMHSYQIENVVSLMSGKQHISVNPAQQASSMNPLGEFQGFQSIQKLAAQGDSNVIDLF